MAKKNILKEYDKRLVQTVEGEAWRRGWRLNDDTYTFDYYQKWIKIFNMEEPPKFDRGSYWDAKDTKTMRKIWEYANNPKTLKKVKDEVDAEFAKKEAAKLKQQEEKKKLAAKAKQEQQQKKQQEKYIEKIDRKNAAKAEKASRVDEEKIIERAEKALAKDTARKQKVVEKAQEKALKEKIKLYSTVNPKKLDAKAKELTEGTVRLEELNKELAIIGPIVKERYDALAKESVYGSAYLGLYDAGGVPQAQYDSLEEARKAIQRSLHFLGLKTSKVEFQKDIVEREFEFSIDLLKNTYDSMNKNIKYKKNQIKVSDKKMNELAVNFKDIYNYISDRWQKGKTKEFYEKVAKAIIMKFNAFDKRHSFDKFLTEIFDELDAQLEQGGVEGYVDRLLAEYKTLI